MVLDGNCRPDWTQATARTDRFPVPHLDVRVLIDLSRHGATGRNPFLAKPG